MYKEKNTMDEEETQRQKVLREQLEQRESRIQEIERRKQVRDAQQQQKQKSLPNADESITIQSRHNYTYAVINKANKQLNPPCERPAFRILGLFTDNPGDFDNWIQDLRDSNLLQYDEQRKTTVCKLGDLHRLPLVKYTLIASSSERERDESCVAQKIEELKGLYAKEREFAASEFRKDRSSNHEEKIGMSLEKQCKKARQERREQTSQNKSLQCDVVPDWEIGLDIRSMRVVRRVCLSAVFFM